MKCSSVKAEINKAADGRSLVKLIVGNHPERLGKLFQVAWVEMPPGMAESIAKDMLEAAAEVRRQMDSDGRQESPA